MKTSRPGRNEPCHCGSGKKYKNCCLELDELLGTDLTPFEQYNRLITTCKMKLDQEYGSQIKKVRKDLQNKFLRFSTNKELPSDHESLFSDWLWFDYLDSDENTFAFHYLNNRMDYLQTPLQGCMGTLMLSYLSVYEPIKSTENALMIKDLFTDAEMEVLLSEPFEGDIANTHFLLLGRVLRFQQDNVFSGMVLVIQDDGGQNDFILKHMNYLLEHREEKPINALKFNAEILYGLFDHAFHKNLFSLSEIRAYPLDKPEILELKQKILTFDLFEFDYATEDVEWFSATDPMHYMKIGIHPDNLLTCADRINEIESLQEFCQKILPDHESIILSHAFAKMAPAPEFIPLWFECIKDRESERWLHAMHPELGNKTPLDVLQEDGGVNRLNDLLDRFAEQSPDSSETNEILNHMRLRIQS